MSANAKGKRRRKSRRRGMLAGWLMLIVIIIYTPALLKWFFTDRQETAVVKQDVLEVRIPVDGLFLREETVLIAPGTGTLIPQAQNGDRVGLGGIIASHVGADRMDLVRQYRASEQEILKRVVENPGTMDPATLNLWKESIENQVNRLVTAANAGSLGELGEARESMNRVLEERARVLLDKGSGKNYLESEKADLELLKSHMADSVLEIRAQKPGIVCYSVDGMESVFPPERRTSLTAEEIDAVIPVEREPVRVTPTELPVVAEEAYGRLVQNDVAWFVFPVQDAHAEILTTKLAKAAQDGLNLKMKMRLDETAGYMPIVVTDLHADSAGRTVVVAKLTRNVETLTDIRKTSAEIVISQIEGMKVPVGSLLNRNVVDDTADLVLVKMDRASIRRVQVVGEQDGWAIITNLPQSTDAGSVSVFDIYLVNPAGVVEGQVINR